MAPSDINLVYSVSISLRFAENRAMLPLQVDPCDRKRIFLRVAAKAKAGGIPDRNPGRQPDVQDVATSQLRHFAEVKPV
jgi:hypothetical protein